MVDATQEGLRGFDYRLGVRHSPGILLSPPPSVEWRQTDRTLSPSPATHHAKENDREVFDFECDKFELQFRLMPDIKLGGSSEMQAPQGPVAGPGQVPVVSAPLGPGKVHRLGRPPMAPNKWGTSSNEWVHGPNDGDGVGFSHWKPVYKWHVSPADNVYYATWITIEGPHGVPYK